MPVSKLEEKMEQPTNGDEIVQIAQQDEKVSQRDEKVSQRGEKVSQRAVLLWKHTREQAGGGEEIVQKCPAV